MKKLLFVLVCAVGLAAGVEAASHGASVDRAAAPMSRDMMQAMMVQSMQIFDVAEDVGFEEAIESMKLRANTLNFKMVAELPLSRQVEAMGLQANPMQILAFCDAAIANEMVKFNIIFAGYLPCRIAIVQDEAGNNRIVTLNMDMMVNAIDLPPELHRLATQVRDTIYSIVDAGVNGDL